MTRGYYHLQASGGSQTDGGPECARIDVPVFLAVGDRDIAGPPHQIPASFPASPDVTLLILPATGHCHILFPSRRRLFERAADWIHCVTNGITPNPCDAP